MDKDIAYISDSVGLKYYQDYNVFGVWDNDDIIKLELSEAKRLVDELSRFIKIAEAKPKTTRRRAK